MNYRKINLEQDYPILKEFWEKSKMKTAPPIDMLTSNAMIAFTNSGDIVGAVFSWLTQGSYTALIGFPILDDDYREADRLDVLKTLFEKSETIASYMGYRYSIHYSGLPMMTDFMKSIGYTQGDETVISLVKGIGW